MTAEVISVVTLHTSDAEVVEVLVDVEAVVVVVVPVVVVVAATISIATIEPVF